MFKLETNTKQEIVFVIYLLGLKSYHLHYYITRVIDLIACCIFILCSVLQAGDLEMLDLVTRMKLARILDQAEKTSNWQVLAQHFKMDQLCEAFSTMKSPTQALLDNLEVGHS